MKTLYIVLFLNLHGFLFSKAAETQVIRVIVEENSDNKDVQKFIVSQHKDLVIILANDDNDIAATDVRCHWLVNQSAYLLEVDKEYLERNITSNRITTKLEIPTNQITANVSKLWKCVMTFGDQTKYVLFEVRVKGAKRVRVTDGFSELKFSLTEESVVEYDGFHVYPYIDMEVVDLTCSDTDGVRLPWDYNGSNKKRLPFTFPLLMINEYNQSYVDCTSIQEEGDIKQEFTYRVIFLATYAVSSTDMLEVYVDDTKVQFAQTCHRNPVNYTINAKNFFTVTCVKADQLLRGDIEYEYEGNPKAVVERTKYYYILHSAYLDEAKLQCRLNKYPNSNTSLIFHAYFKSEMGPPTSLAIGCLSAILLIVAVVICVYCWYKRNKNTKLPENFNQVFNHPVPHNTSQWRNSENEYTYIENDYNYLSNDSIMINNPMYYKQPQIYATPHERMAASRVHSVQENSEMDVNLFNQNKNRPIPYQHHDIPSPGSTDCQYEILKREEYPIPNENSTINSTPRNIHYSNTPKENGYNIKSDLTKDNSKNTQKELNIPKYSNIPPNISEIIKNSKLNDKMINLNNDKIDSDESWTIISKVCSHNYSNIPGQRSNVQCSNSTDIVTTL